MATCFRGAVPFARRAFVRLPAPVAVQCRAIQPTPFAAFRFFTASALRTAAAKAKPSAVPKVAKTPAIQPYEPKTRLPPILMGITSETVLYSAPKQTGFRTVCYAAAFACFGAAAISYEFFYRDVLEGRERKELPSWVPLAFGVIAVFWAGMGTWLAAAPLGMVKTISAVPGLGPRKSLALRVEVMRLPGLANKIMYAAPSEIAADSSIAATAAEYARVRQAIIASKQPHPNDPMLLKPVLALGRFVGRSIYSLMIYTKMSMMRAGIVKLCVGRSGVCKVDCAGGLVSDGARALDQLMGHH